jgi:hypothetical protein
VDERAVIDATITHKTTGLGIPIGYLLVLKHTEITPARLRRNLMTTAPQV